MTRLNMLLLLFVVVCALGVVTSQHKARKLYQDLEAGQENARRLEVEYGQLQLEMTTWATPPRIEQIARDKLKMRLLDATGRAVAPAPEPARIAPVKKPVGKKAVRR